jgi:hypothetical protein
MSALAAVSVEGNTSSVQVVADKATVSEVLSALSSSLSLQYNTTANLDTIIGGTYRGSLVSVLREILRGHNYVIKTLGAATSVIVLGKAGELPVASGVSPVGLAPVNSAAPPKTNQTTESRHTR